VRYLKIRKVLLTDEVDRWLGELASITKQSRSAVVRQLIADRKIRMGELFKIN
jgi:predicted transcriptional regulator